MVKLPKARNRVHQMWITSIEWHSCLSVIAMHNPIITSRLLTQQRLFPSQKIVFYLNKFFKVLRNFIVEIIRKGNACFFKYSLVLSVLCNQAFLAIHIPLLEVIIFNHINHVIKVVRGERVKLLHQKVKVRVALAYCLTLQISRPVVQQMEINYSKHQNAVYRCPWLKVIFGNSKNKELWWQQPCCFLFI